MTNVMVRDLDVVRPDPRDRRRLEIVAVGVPLFRGATARWTQPLSPVYIVMVPFNPELPTWTKQCGMQRANGRTAFILSSLVHVGDFVWLFWQVTSGAHGRRKLDRS